MNTRTPASRPLFYLLAATACILWGTAFPAAKVALRYLPPLTLAGVRFILAGIMLIPFWPRREKPLSQIGSNLPTIILLSLLQTIILYSLFFIGMQLARGSRAAIIIGCAPLVTALLAHLLQKNEKLDLRRITALLAGSLSVGVVSWTSRPSAAVRPGELLGLGLLFIGVISSSLGNILVARRKDHLHPVLLNSSQIFLGGCVLLLLGLAVEGPQLSQLSFGQDGTGAPPQALLFSLLWLAGISAAGFTAWFYLLGKIPVSDLNTWKFIIPLTGVLLSWLIIPEETPDPWTALGMIGTAASVLLYYYRGKRTAC
jgi:drug/metabolite transporter (DMT)-like permease